MTIVAAVDSSERATSVLEHGRRLADDADRELHVVHVGEVGVPNPHGVFDPDRDRAMALGRSGGIARTIAAEAGLEEFVPVGLEGNPATAILEYAAEQDADYIVVSARKRSAIGKVVFDSVSQRLLLEADRPVVATPPPPA